MKKIIIPLCIFLFLTPIVFGEMFLSAGKNVSADGCSFSACTDGTDYSPSNINDGVWACGDLGSCIWISSVTTEGWIQIDLNNPYKITRVSIIDGSHSAYDREPTTGKLYYSNDNATWTFFAEIGSMAGGAQNNVTKLIGADFSEFTARYVRYANVSGEGNAAAVGEMFIYGTSQLMYTFISPNNSSMSNTSLNVTMNVLDESGGIECYLRVNDSGLVAKKDIVSGVTFNLTYKPATDGTYKYNVSCNSTGNSTLIYDTMKTFIYDIRAPLINDITDNADINYPQIGDILHVNASFTDNNNLSSCSFQTNITGSLQSVQTVYYTSLLGNAQFNYTIPSTAITNKSSLIYAIRCNDSAGNINVSTPVAFKVYDATNPQFTLIGNNTIISNNSVISSYLNRNASINILFEDANLFQASVNISCDINQSLYSWELLDINTSDGRYWHNNTFSLANVPMQRCTYNIMVSDDHTLNEIKSYDVERLAGTTIKFVTEEKNDVRIESKEKASDIRNLITEKKRDRYSFSYEYENEKSRRIFSVKANNKIIPRYNSKYPGHFVIWNEETNRGTWLDFESNDTTLYDYSYSKISDTEYEVYVDKKDAKPIKTIKFNSIGGTNYLNVTYDFYIGTALNLTHINMYDNTSQPNFNVTVTTNNSLYPVNGTFNISGTTGFLSNLTAGNYTIVFTKDGFFSKTHTLEINSTLTQLPYRTYQAEAFVRVVNIKTGEHINNSVLTVRNQVSGDLRTYTTNTTGQFMYLNASTYNFTGIYTGYVNSSRIETIAAGTSGTYNVVMGFYDTFYLKDEKTGELFNMTDMNITFFLFCPPDITYTYPVTTNNYTTLIDCEYEKFRFLLTFPYILQADGYQSYYRTFILDPVALTTDVYLIDARKDLIIQNSFVANDLLTEYHDVSIIVKKTIGNQTYQITGDYIDVEKKITAYLMYLNSYIIEVHSSNQPVRVMGNYDANSEGAKNIKLYDIKTYDTIPNFINGVTTYSYRDNSTDPYRIITVYNDSTQKTTGLTWRLYKNTINSTPVRTIYSTENSVIFSYVPSIDEINGTLIVKLEVEHNQSGLQSFYSVVQDYQRDIRGFLNPIKEYVSQEAIDWAILLVLCLLSLYLTINTATFGAVIISGLGFIFISIRWFWADSSGAALALATALLVFSIINFLIERGRKV